MAKLADGLCAFVTAVAGIALYFLGDRQSWLWVLGIIVVGALLGWTCLAVGRRVLAQRPIVGVLFITGWLIALIAAGAAIISGLALAAIAVGHGLASLDEKEANVIGSLAVAALTTFAGVFTDLQRNSFSVAAQSQKAIADTFTNRFKSNTRPYEAVFEERMRGASKIGGWGFLARIRRAKVISSSLHEALPKPPTATAK